MGLELHGELVGVAMAGWPRARALADGRTLEVARTCTLEVRNANSMLYGAICRAAAALGYARVVTYTLESESGASLRAAGFAEVARSDDDRARVRTERTWGDGARPRYSHTLWGERVTPAGRKVRWERRLC